MSDMNRREALTLIAIAPLATAAGVRAPVLSTAPDVAEPAQQAPQTRFFTAHELAMVTVLADLVIPADERSGSASSAGVPAFMDFMLGEPGQDNARLAIRGGLAWMDAECRRRYQKPFLDCTQAERTGILDEIAWPARARPEMSHGVAFFSRFRDQVASGFWSSQTGVRDLQYMGNTPRPAWDGCPPEALAKLGVRYEG